MKLSLRDILLGLLFPVLAWLCIQVQDLKVAVARVEERVKAAETGKAAEIGPLPANSSLAFGL